MMDFLLEFATTGRIGAVRTGMTLAEAESLLGAGNPHPMYRMRPDATGYPYNWDSLSLGITDGVVDRVSVRVVPGDVFHVPASLWPELGGSPSTFAKREVLVALAESGCLIGEEEHTSEPGQTKVRTKAGTVLEFNHRAASGTVAEAGSYLTSLHILA